MKLNTIKRSLCGSCLFTHQEKKDFYRKCERQVAKNVMIWQINKRKKDLQPLIKVSVCALGASQHM